MDTYPAFRDNLVAFTQALGPEAATLILPLSSAPWPTATARDEFIAGVAGAGDLFG